MMEGVLAMGDRVTSADVLAAVERLGRQSDARWVEQDRQMATLGAGQQNLDRRMTSMETEMKQIGACVAVNTGRLGVLEAASSDYDGRVEKLEDREREGAIKQAGMTATIAAFMAWIVPGIKARLGLP